VLRCRIARFFKLLPFHPFSRSVDHSQRNVATVPFDEWPAFLLRILTREFPTLRSRGDEKLR
jgi:hypothetical protein